jgi:hypothetical protein
VQVSVSDSAISYVGAGKRQRKFVAAGIVGGDVERWGLNREEFGSKFLLMLERTK